MSYKVFIVDAFTGVKFAGNQAAVVLIPETLDDAVYQKLGAEFNLSETAVPIPLSGDWKTSSRFSLRWFTPKTEVNLCGHATLATAHVLFNEMGNVNEQLTFETLSGELAVTKSDSGLIMDFPQYRDCVYFNSDSLQDQNAYKNEPKSPGYVDRFIDLLGLSMVQTICLFKHTRKLIIELGPETTKDELLSVSHNGDMLLGAHDGSVVRGIIVTIGPKDAKIQGFVDADGKPYDYISRYFAPWAGINEDPATGSSQTVLGPFWKKHQNKTGPFYAYQCYPGRGAEFIVSFPSSERVNIEGQALTIVRGEMEL